MMTTPSVSEQAVNALGVPLPSRARLAVLVLVAVGAGLAGCGSDRTEFPDESRSSPTSAGRATSAPSDVTTPSPSSSSSPPLTPSSSPTPPKPVTIAFAGDVHFEGILAPRLDDPSTAMGPLSRRLARADLAIVNLETAVTTRGSPQPKEYRFRAPDVVFDALKQAGVDVVTMANNHGLDYGPVSVPDALAAAKDAGMPVIGLGRNAEQAYRPWIVRVNGQRIAFLAATAVVDSSLVASWSASRDQPGVATALDGDNAALVDAIEAVRPRVDTVVVDMHYGSDLMACPTDIQRAVAEDVVRAGADVVVGQHAHVLLGAGYLGSAYVDYGMGNFQFYSSGGQTAETGVLTLTAVGREITDPRWFPGRLVNGLPTALTGAAAEQAIDHWTGLRSCTGLTDKAVSR